ncbi:MAG TPA: glycosyltransferase family 87 protein [Chloroflexota bacterium]
MRRRGLFALTVALFVFAIYDAIQLTFFLRAGFFPDFRLFWNAARLVLAHGPGAVYATQASPWPYLNPPLLAWLVIPLAALPFDVAYAIWIVASLAALTWAAWVAGVGWRGALAGLALLPAFVAIGSGQVAPLILLALVWAVRLEARGRWITAGLLFSLLAVKPQLGFLLPVALLASSRWRPVAATAAAGAVIGAATVASLGFDGVRSWATAVSAFSHNSYFLRWSLVSLVGDSGWWLALPIVAALVGLGARRWKADPMMVVGLGVCGSILVNHYLTPSDLVVLLLPVWALLRARSTMAALGGLLWTGTWLCLWFPWATIAAESLVLVAAALPFVAPHPLIRSLGVTGRSGCSCDPPSGRHSAPSRP